MWIWKWPQPRLSGSVWDSIWKVRNRQTFPMLSQTDPDSFGIWVLCESDIWMIWDHLGRSGSIWDDPKQCEHHPSTIPDKNLIAHLGWILQCERTTGTIWDRHLGRHPSVIWDNVNQPLKKRHGKFTGRRYLLLIAKTCYGCRYALELFLPVMP
jgi:hypothetical protein